VKLRRTLSTLPLVFILYFCTSGGPYTTEELVAKVGPGLGLLILLLVPIFWSVPEALIVGELASMLPEEGGYYRWVYRAFGRFWAFQNGWWTWMYSLFDMAIYPVMFNTYLAFFFPHLTAGRQWIVALAVIWGATAINLRGALPVGRVSVAAGGVILAAFVGVVAAALPHVHHLPWVPFHAPERAGAGAIGVALSLALWNYIGWDNASTVQGEVVDATRSYPRALAWSVPLVVLNYLVPLAAALAATDWTAWRGRAWPEIARMAAGGRTGAVLAAVVAAGGMLSALALYNSLLLAYSRIPLAMAQDGMLPAAIAKTDRNGTPRNAVLFAALFYSAFALIPLEGLVVADVLLYAMALSLEFGALIALRRREPGLRGAFRIPVGDAGVTVMAAVPMAILVVVVALEITQPEYGLPAVLGALGTAGLGLLAYVVFERRPRGPGRPGPAAGAGPPDEVEG
jgi:amino acid transporter